MWVKDQPGIWHSVEQGPIPLDGTPYSKFVCKCERVFVDNNVPAQTPQASPPSPIDPADPLYMSEPVCSICKEP